MSIKQEEIKLKEKSFLVSETDLNGIIKFANDDFCEYSNKSLDELIGKNHNMVRHPDMPLEVFANMWNTIKSGKTWKGFIKNQAGNNRFYWAFATVYPFKSCDGTQGFISCRKRASKAEIEKYQKIYKEMKAS